jgi:hypothetical protein
MKRVALALSAVLLLGATALTQVPNANSFIGGNIADPAVRTPISVAVIPAIWMPASPTVIVSRSPAIVVDAVMAVMVNADIRVNLLQQTVRVAGIEVGELDSCIITTTASIG